MKFFTVFAAVCAVATASQGWTLSQLSNALQSSATDVALKPVLEQALDHVMDSIYTQDNYAPLTITTAAGVSGYYNLAQLEALINSNTNPIFIPYIEHAFEKLIGAIFAGEQIVTVPLMIPALDISYMTPQELSQALYSPATNPALVPYLEYSLNQFMDSALHSGQQMEAIVVAVPSGLGEIGGSAPAPAPSPIVVPSPVYPSPIVPGPSAPEASSPLVQIILNVRQSEDVDVAGPVAIRPNPV